MLDLEPAGLEIVRLCDGVTDADLDRATPCEGLPVSGLLNHIIGLSLAFTFAARKEVLASPAGPPSPSLDPGWRSLIAERTKELVEAWRDPAAWEGMSEAGGQTLPAHVIAAVALDEIALHGWDLARATGQSYRVDAATTAAVLRFTTAAAAPENAQGRAGLFGPVVDVAPDAPDFDRALGLAGRDPNWTPPAA